MYDITYFVVNTLVGVIGTTESIPCLIRYWFRIIKIGLTFGKLAEDVVGPGLDGNGTGKYKAELCTNLQVKRNDQIIANLKINSDKTKDSGLKHGLFQILQDIEHSRIMVPDCSGTGSDCSGTGCCQSGHIKTKDINPSVYVPDPYKCD